MVFSLRLVFEENIWGYYGLGVLVCWTLTGVLRGRLSASVVVWAALLVLSTGLDSGELILPGRLDVQERPRWFQLVLLPLALVISVNDLRRSGQPPEFEWCR